MSQNREKKVQLVNDVAADIQNSADEKGANTFVFDYTGITSADINALRSTLYGNSAKLKVVKNTLIKRIFADLGVENASEVKLEGQSAIVVTSEDFISPIKSLSEFIKKSEKGQFKMGVLNGKLISGEDVVQLAKLPSKEELLAKVLGGFNAPVRSFASLLNAVPTSFVRVIDAIKESKS